MDATAHNSPSVDTPRPALDVSQASASDSEPLFSVLAVPVDPVVASIPLYPTREQWLNAAVTDLATLFDELDHTVPPVAVSIGWPGYGGVRSKRIGECWDKAASSKGVPEIFISPRLNNVTEILATLLHEMAHAVLGSKEGHGKAFKQLVSELGLEGKATATHAGEAFKRQAERVVARLGEYPGATLTVELSGQKKQTTRLLKAECPLCGYAVRVTAKWVSDKGAPRCGDPEHAAGGAMEIEGHEGQPESGEPSE